MKVRDTVAKMKPKKRPARKRYQIEAQTKSLIELRPKVIPRSFFGDDNLAALDAQIEVLEERMGEDDVYAKGWPGNIERAAAEAAEWLAGTGDIEDLAAEERWPIKTK